MSGSYGPNQLRSMGPRANTATALELVAALEQKEKEKEKCWGVPFSPLPPTEQTNLDNLKLQAIRIDNDGNCLFAALARHFNIILFCEYGLLDRFDHIHIRTFVCDYMSKNYDFFSGFIGGKEEDFKDYILKMRKPTTWGGEPELNAAIEFFASLSRYSKERLQTGLQKKEFNYFQRLPLYSGNYLETQDLRNYFGIKILNIEKVPWQEITQYTSVFFPHYLLKSADHYNFACHKEELPEPSCGGNWEGLQLYNPLSNKWNASIQKGQSAGIPLRVLRKYQTWTLPPGAKPSGVVGLVNLRGKNPSSAPGGGGGARAATSSKWFTMSAVEGLPKEDEGEDEDDGGGGSGGGMRGGGNFSGMDRSGINEPVSNWYQFKLAVQ